MNALKKQIVNQSAQSKTATDLDRQLQMKTAEIERLKETIQQECEERNELLLTIQRLKSGTSVNMHLPRSNGKSLQVEEIQSEIEDAFQSMALNAARKKQLKLRSQSRK